MMHKQGVHRIEFDRERVWIPRHGANEEGKESMVKVLVGDKCRLMIPVAKDESRESVEARIKDDPGVDGIRSASGEFEIQWISERVVRIGPHR
jgi:hypothetical protein